MILIRSFVFNTAFCFWTIFVCVFSLPALLVSQRATIWISELWAIVSLWLLRLIVGLSYEVRAWDNLPRGAAIVALKHQSAWDAIALWVLLEKPVIVVKQSVARIPLFGWYVRRGKAIVVDRNAGAKTLKSMVAAAQPAVAEGRPIAIFPEGTRTRVGAREPYHPGVAALYMQLGLPLVPVALNSGLFWGHRSLLQRPGRVLVEFLPPIEPGLGRRQVMAELERRIEQATALLVGESQSREAHLAVNRRQQVGNIAKPRLEKMGR